MSYAFMVLHLYIVLSCNSSGLNLALKITLNFLTPTRIKSDGSLTSQLSFELLISSLIRRLSALSYFHCGGGLNIDYDHLIMEAKGIQTTSSELKWYDWERYSSRQQTSMMLGGFIGKISYEGDNLSKFLPLLFIGTLIHIGNGATFGLGRYEIGRGKYMQSIK